MLCLRIQKIINNQTYQKLIDYISKREIDFLVCVCN